MLRQSDNELLTRVEAGSLLGELFRYYWYPVAFSKDIQPGTIKKIRLLGENYILFKATSGRFGLLAESCPHRGASLANGIVDEDGLRCPYHGIKFTFNGECTDIPHAPPNPDFKCKLKQSAGSVEEAGGFIFVYIGSLPAPVLPLFDTLRANCRKKIKYAVIPCNWLQIMENAFDPVHLEWLHGHFHNANQKDGDNIYSITEHEVIEFVPTQYGFTKRRALRGQPRDNDDWAIGQQLIFPFISRFSKLPNISMHFRVPIDSYNTIYYWYECDLSTASSTDADIELHEIKYLAPDGQFLLDSIEAEDIMIFLSQGVITNRNHENLFDIDKGIIQYRNLLFAEARKAEEKKNPMMVLWDPNLACIEFPSVRKSNSVSVLNAVS